MRNTWPTSVQHWWAHLNSSTNIKQTCVLHRCRRWNQRECMQHSNKSNDKISFNTVAVLDGNQDFFILTYCNYWFANNTIHMIIHYLLPPNRCVVFPCALSPPVSSFAMPMLRCRNFRGASDRWLRGRGYGRELMWVISICICRHQGIIIICTHIATWKRRTAASPL